MKTWLESAADESYTEPFTARVESSGVLRLSLWGRESKLLLIELRVRDTELFQRRRRAAVPVGIHCIADVAQVLHAHTARPESRRREVAKAIEKLNAIGHSRGRTRRPRDVVQNLFTLLPGGR